MITTEQIRNQILTHLRDLGDQDMQKKEWTTNVKETWYFPDEIFARWFDDTFKNNPDTFIKDGFITQEEWEIVKPLNTKLNLFADKYEQSPDQFPANLLEVKEWIEISLLAKTTEQKLLKLGWNVPE